MNIVKDFSLKQYNTFGIDARAEYFTVIANNNNLIEVADLPYKKRVLGGGSNILLTNSIKGIVLKNELKGISITEENNDYVVYEVQSGEIWHSFVMSSIENGLCGLENLALIPGTVGAAPIQNIGAYGAEAKDTIVGVKYFDFSEKNFKYISASECKFGYRTSIFKTEALNNVFISSVLFKLNKKCNFNTNYGDINAELEKMGVVDLSAKAIAQAVINIRKSKLPNPTVIGNAGSFYKNPIISLPEFMRLKIEYPLIPFYNTNEADKVKIPAGWLIEKCGFKGITSGNVGVHQNQALILINKGNATGEEILKLSDQIVKTVKNKFGVELEREVQLW